MGNTSLFMTVLINSIAIKFYFKAIGGLPA